MNELATMKAKTGFKQTEVGLIPEDWEVETFENTFTFLNSGTFSRAQLYANNDVKCIHYGDIHTKFNHYIDFSLNEMDGCTYKEAKRYDFVQNGDIVMADASEDTAGIGKSVEIKNLKNKAIAGLHTFLLRDKGFFIDGFRGYIHSMLPVKSSLDRLATGLKVYGISKANLKNILIPIPPLDEQKAIATALSDVDALFQSLDALIAKKKAIKQGAMQELLTPKDGWKTKTIKEVSTFRRGSFPQPYGLPKWYDDISGMPFVQVVDVAKNRKLKTETKQRISEEGAKMSVFVKKGSIILTIQGSIGRICITQYDAYVDRTLLIFESLLEEFNKYFFMTIVHQKFEIEKEKAPGGIIKTITKEALSSFEVSYPNIIDQNRIAQILSDMDLEIESLERKKGKYEKIKQGMMQELLTGKTRLV